MTFSVVPFTYFYAGSYSFLIKIVLHSRRCNDAGHDKYGIILNETRYMAIGDLPTAVRYSKKNGRWCVMNQRPVPM